MQHNEKTCVTLQKFGFFSFLRKSGKLAKSVGTLMSTHLVIIGLNNGLYNAIGQK